MNDNVAYLTAARKKLRNLKKDIDMFREKC